MIVAKYKVLEPFRIQDLRGNIVALNPDDNDEFSATIFDDENVIIVTKHHHVCPLTLEVLHMIAGSRFAVRV